MKIEYITNERIVFDNGSYITYEHDPDCCELNYADFRSIDSHAWGYNFDDNLIFESYSGYGFGFGDNANMMFRIPCYSCQNGYYSNDLDIVYMRRSAMLTVEAKIVE